MAFNFKLCLLQAGVSLAYIAPNYDSLKIDINSLDAEAGECSHGSCALIATADESESSAVEVDEVFGPGKCDCALPKGQKALPVHLQMPKWCNRVFDDGKKLGNGAFGSVLRGVLRDGSQVAIKYMHAQTPTKKMGEVAPMIAMGNSEAASMILMRDSPYIVKLIDSGRQQAAGKDEYMMIMPRASGDLAKMTMKDDPRSLSFKPPTLLQLLEIAYIMAEISTGIAAMHAKGLVHRDLKPENILRTCAEEGKCLNQVADLGIACAQTGFPAAVTGIDIPDNALNDDAQTVNIPICDANTRAGTILYVGPEFFKKGAIQGKSSDVWALGLIGYQMIFKSLPPQLQKAVSMKDLEGQIPLLSKKDPSEWHPPSWTKVSKMGDLGKTVIEALQGMLISKRFNAMGAAQKWTKVFLAAAGKPDLVINPDAETGEQLADIAAALESFHVEVPPRVPDCDKPKPK